MSSELVLGIDLGTSFSTAAAVVDGRLHFVTDARGEACIPSVVYFPKSGAPVVGAEAEKQRASDPENVIFGIKRVIGRAADSPQGRLLDAVAAFRLKPPPGGGEAQVQVRGGTHGASEVAAILLRHLRERAQTKFGPRVGKAVLTVPVTATPEVRTAMVKAGKMAGLEVVRIVSEPCAGAVPRAGAAKDPVCVFDFGGGTLDVTIVQRDGAALRVRASGGDEVLGGDDLDLAFARWIANGVHRVRGVDVTRDAVVWDRVQRQCELTKRALSAGNEARYLVRDAFHEAGRPVPLDMTVRRDHLAPVWKELVERSVAATVQTLAGAGLGPAQLAGVLCVGGTTYVPQVRAAVQAAIPRPCTFEDDPQTAVARGAAMLAANPGLVVD